MMYPCQFGQILAIGSEDRVRKSLFHSYMTLVILKIRSRTPKSNHLERSTQLCFCTSLVKLWLFVHQDQVQKIECRQGFFIHCSYTNLKIRSMSPHLIIYQGLPNDVSVQISAPTFANHGCHIEVNILRTIFKIGQGVFKIVRKH